VETILRLGSAIEVWFEVMKQLSDYIKNIKPERVLVIFPHPDDETMMVAGLIQHLIGEGIAVRVICLTSGGSGKIHIHGRGRSLSEIREREMASAMKILGVSDYQMRGMADGRLRYNKKLDQAVEVMVDEYHPDLLVGYDLSGVTGHPDHITLGRVMTRVAKKRKIAMLFPVMVGVMAERLLDDRVAYLHPNASLVMRMSLGQSWRKWHSLSVYRSQAMDRFALPKLWWVWNERKEYFAVLDRNKKYKYRYVKFGY
jgi:N-acetylglucosamine malate deacetylase 2